jgi:bifunctional oligoribonuclease and PAP phosphatase NrnA
VEVAVLFRQTGAEQYKISLRGKGRIDLSNLATTLGGGGHKNAAGGMLDGAFPSVRDKVLIAIGRELEAQLGRKTVSPL